MPQMHASEGLRKDPKEGWGQDALLFDSTADTKAFKCVVVTLDCYLHTLMQ